MIAFNCPGCGKSFCVKDEFAGRKTRCPKCRTRFVVPATETAISPAPPWYMEKATAPVPIEPDSPEQTRPRSRMSGWPAAIWVLAAVVAALVSLALVVLIVILLTIFKPGLSADQRKKAVDAVRALEKLDAATDVGINVGRYHDLVIEAKQAVEEATRVLPGGELRSLLTEALGYHKEAAIRWEENIRLGIRFENDTLVRHNWHRAKAVTEKARALVGT